MWEGTKERSGLARKGSKVPNQKKDKSGPAPKKGKGYGERIYKDVGRLIDSLKLDSISSHRPISLFNDYYFYSFKTKSYSETKE